MSDSSASFRCAQEVFPSTLPSSALAALGDGEVRETVEIPTAPAARTWILEVQDDAGARRVPLPPEGVVLGSSQRRAGVVLEDPTVSGRHCVVGVRGGDLFVEDAGSRNGTFAGGARVKQAWSNEGVILTLGQSTIVCTPGSLDENGDDLEEIGEPLPGITGASLAMRRLAGLVRRLARLGAPTLVTGETGVGKELVARALHHEGPRTNAPFVAMNVAALPRELVESEMFGHERGAFTGAVTRRVGAFTEAEGGTLFLDEIGELPLEAQPKLLRALDGYEVRRVGGAGSGKRASARVVAATHVALLDRVEQGTFRRDLFHRLEVFVVEVPPLRARPGDIVPIARAVLASLESEIGPRQLSSSAAAQLAAHEWPGNVRELRNILYRAADLCGSRRMIDGITVQRALRKSPKIPAFALTPDLARAWLARHDGNVSAASRAAGVPRTSFRKLVAARGPGPARVESGPASRPALAVAEPRSSLDREAPR